jgi:hypothetical protein
MKSESVTTALAMQSLRLGLPIVARAGKRTRALGVGCWWLFFVGVDAFESSGLNVGYLFRPACVVSR